MISPDRIIRPHFRDIQLGLPTGGIIIDSQVGLMVNPDTGFPRNKMLTVWAPRRLHIVLEGAVKSGGFKPDNFEGDGEKIGALRISFLRNSRVAYIGDQYRIEYLHRVERPNDLKFLFRLTSTEPISLSPVKRSEDMKARLAELLRQRRAQ